MREDTITQIVYAIDEGNITERLLYNFKITVGDSIFIPNTIDTGSVQLLQKEYYVCDSITIPVEYNGDSLRIIILVIALTNKLIIEVSIESLLWNG